MLKNKNFLYIILLSFIIISGSIANAIEIVYPKQNPAKINAASTFFIGNTKPKSILSINEIPVKIWDDGSFVQVVPLKEGENIFNIKSELDGIKEKTSFTIQKATAQATTEETSEFEAFKPEEYLYSTAIKDDIPLRLAPDDNAPRISHLTKGTVLILEGKKGKYYKVNVGNASSVWVGMENVVVCANIQDRILASVCDVKIEDDKNFSYLKLNLNIPVAYKVTESENNLELNIYGLKYSKELVDAINCQQVFESIKIKQTENNNIVLEIPSAKKLWGYDCYYENNQLIFKKRKTPTINQAKPLENITIAIDAGHGGGDSGAIGPTCEKEKNINLDIAKKLEVELKNAGANVIMTRIDDTNTDLYERVKIAKTNNALISISVHANALPDGANPMIKHGTATFYYYPEAKDLAQTLKTQLITDLQTKDDGCSKGSFVLTRATAPLSVLIEVAYMIHPQEYQLLLDDTFRQSAAASIRKGLETYLINSTATSATIK